MNRVRQARRARRPKMTQERLAAALGCTQSVISKIENGSMELTVSMAEQIADHLQVPLIAILPLGRSVSVAGRVGAGARVPLVDGYEKGDGLYHVACPADLPFNDGLVAVEIVGGSMSPVYEDGDLLFYSRASLGVPTEAVGSKCVCEDESGDVWVKQVKRGSAPGLFHLVSLNPTAENMHDVKLKWAAPIVMHLPMALVQPMDG